MRIGIYDAVPPMRANDCPHDHEDRFRRHPGFREDRRSRGLRKAASHLHLTQTALTRRMQKLEAYLGMRLLDRTTRAVHLTGIGRDFLPQAARIVSDMTAAIERLKDISRLGKGDVTIASIPTMAHHALPAVMRTYAERCPGNRIRIIESSASEVRRTVLQDQADFGITLSSAASSSFRSSASCANRSCSSAASSIPEHTAHGDVEGCPRDGAHHGQRTERQSRPPRLSARAAAPEPAPRYEVEHLSTAIGLVTAGVGTAILPSSTILEGPIRSCVAWRSSHP